MKHVELYGMRFRSRVSASGRLLPLRGFKPTRYSAHVNGPWCITFEFEEGDARRGDFEQYH